MKQTAEERRLYHQTREDRQHKVLKSLRQRVSDIKAGRRLSLPGKLAVYECDIAALSRKVEVSGD